MAIRMLRSSNNGNTDGRNKLHRDGDGSDEIAGLIHAAAGLAAITWSIGSSGYIKRTSL